MNKGRRQSRFERETSCLVRTRSGLLLVSVELYFVVVGGTPPILHRNLAEP
jgi:hypothetical protein